MTFIPTPVVSFTRFERPDHVLQLAHLVIHAQSFALLPLFPLLEDEIEVAGINEQAGCLPDDEYRVPAMNGIGQQRQPAGDTEIPER